MNRWSMTFGVTAFARAGVACVAIGGALLALPAAGATVAGSTPATFDVSDQGTATYQVPIQVPPGVAGLQPKLALQYDSQGPRGIAGPGWSMAGVPTIRRCAKTDAQDGVRSGVSLSSQTDRFCLQGQRLVLKKDQTKNYGDDGAVYFQEIDSFSRVTSRGIAGDGPESFDVEEKSGQRLQFGGTANSRLLPLQATADTATSTVLTWYVNQITDRSGNVVNFTYVMSGGEILLDKVSYAGGRVQVKLEYRTDKHPRTMFLAGTRFQYRSLLSKITTQLVNPQTQVVEATAKQYRLEYDYTDAEAGVPVDTPTGKLLRVRECASGASEARCLAPLTFQWDAWRSADATFGAAKAIGNPSDPRKRFGQLPAFGDIFMEGGPFLRRVVDLNGDGHKDVVAFWRDGVYAYLSNPDGSYPAEPKRLTTDFSSSDGFLGWGDFNTPTGGGGMRYRELLDVNGDGFPDIVAASNSGPNSNNSGAPPEGLYVAYWDPATQAFKDRVKVGERTVMAGNGYYCSGNGDQPDDGGAPRFLVDLDGDGFPDMIRFTKDGVSAAYWQPASSNYSVPEPVSTQFRQNASDWKGQSCLFYLWNRPIFMEDMNGDGYADIVGIGSDAAYVAYWNPVPDANGKRRFLPSVAAGSSAVSPNDRTASRERLADMNGDGFADIVQFESDGVYVALWSGTSFLTRQRWTTQLSGGDYENASNPKTLADVDGDGLPDLVAFDGTGVRVALNKGMHEAVDQRFAAVTTWTTAFKSNTNGSDGTGTSWDKAHQTPRLTMDVDGDGGVDLIGYGFEHIVWAPGSRMPGSRITAFTDGLGSTVALTYGVTQPFDSALYTTRASALYPGERRADGPTQVVKSVKRSDGRGGLREWTYKYNARVTSILRGDLGFNSRTVTDQATGTTTTRNFFQSFPPLLASEEVAVRGQLVSRTAHDYAMEAIETTKEYPSNSRMFFPPITLVETKWGLDGVRIGGKTGTYKYQGVNGVQYGDMTFKVEDTDIGYSKTVMTYDADAPNWLLGQMKTSTSTSFRQTQTISAARRHLRRAAM
jgi:hypothetical protein